MRLVKTKTYSFQIKLLKNVNVQFVDNSLKQVGIIKDLTIILIYV